MIVRLPASLVAHRSERPVAAVPRPVVAILAVALAAQLAWHGLRPEANVEMRDLPAVPSETAFRLPALGEEPAAARMFMLWLQAFDYQPGISVPFARLDYERLAGWLDRILSLDPRSGYPLLSAARVYSQVPDEARQRRMVAFVREKFTEDPAGRWRWMAHAVYVAKHRLKDLDLALELARELRVATKPDEAPGWARQMELFVLEDMGDVEGARILLGGLIESGAITDPNEIRFLLERLGR